MNTIKYALYICSIFVALTIWGCKSESTVVDSKGNTASKDANNYFKYDLKGMWVSTTDSKYKFEIYDKLYFTDETDSTRQIWDYEIDHNILRLFNPKFSDIKSYLSEGARTLNEKLFLALISKEMNFSFENYAKERIRFYNIIDENNIRGISSKYIKEKGIK